MYLDNVIKSAQTASMPQITYSEIVEDSLRMVEVEGAGQLALLKAEATAHIMGSEAPADWWAKIKTVARKIFEMLKNLLTKVFAFIKTIPTKVATLITRILTKWEKLGMKGKIDRMNKKTGISVRENALKDLKDREFDAIISQNSIGKEFIANAEGFHKVEEAVARAIGALQKDDNDRLEEETQAFKEFLIRFGQRVNDYENRFKEQVETPYKSANDTNTVISTIQSYWNDLKNHTYEKAAKSSSDKFEKFTRKFAADYRLCMSAYERYTRDEDENGVRNALEAAKVLRSAISSNASISAKIAKYYYRDALIAAKIVNAGLAVIKGGTQKPADTTPAST